MAPRPKQDAARRVGGLLLRGPYARAENPRQKTRERSVTPESCSASRITSRLMSTAPRLSRRARQQTRLHPWAVSSERGLHRRWRQLHSAAPSTRTAAALTSPRSEHRACCVLLLQTRRRIGLSPDSSDSHVMDAEALSPSPTDYLA